ncbi:MAG: DUF1015 domain-containing protein [Spirochaetales bacterium]|nr:DUF1015 domain-containing protein [Spirochaetales bacterium]
MNTDERYRNLALSIPKIFLPDRNVDLGKWAVIACDQYTSDPNYWEDVYAYTGNAPSTLHMIFPECFLEEENPQERIRAINSTMDRYVRDHIVREEEPALYLVRRETPFSPARHGLLVALDLEQYDFSPGSKSLIRATEGTILERIPPRKKIRENALLELPHILVLIDDPEHTVIDPLTAKTADFDKMYQFRLMKNGGTVTSFKIDSLDTLEQIIGAFEGLASPENQKKRYNTDNPFLFAMGDGNHSLATAKAVWEDLKKNSSIDLTGHPARYALVEICNIHDPGILFEPIHRALFHVSGEALAKVLADKTNYEFSNETNIGDLVNKVKGSQEHICGIVTSDRKGVLRFRKPEMKAVSGSADSLIHALMKQSPDCRIDYIHGDAAICKIGTEPGNIGFILPAIDKSSFFKTIIDDGVFPRKTFSMGESDEKRFYIESRKIK